MQVWIVEAIEGEYEEMTSWIDKIYSTKEAAERYLTEIGAIFEPGIYNPDPMDIQRWSFTLEDDDCDREYCLYPRDVEE